MTIEERIVEDMKAAMKGKEQIRLRTLRSLRAALKNEAIVLGEERGALNDQMATAVLTREAKKRRESVEQFKQGGREDLAENEEKELEIIQEYLPEQLSEQEIETIVKTVIDEMEEPEFGAVMKTVMEKTRGQADGSVVSGIVKKRLNQ